MLGLPDGACATTLVDGLLATTATVLAEYEHPHFGRFAAIATNPAGSGRITIVGTLPDLATSRALATWLTQDQPDPWRSLAAGSVTLTSGRTVEGHTLRIVHNWSWTPVRIELPEPAAEITGSATPLPTGTSVELGPWDVRVFQQAG
jgi:beta-galactosidase